MASLGQKVLVEIVALRVFAVWLALLVLKV